ILIKIEKIIFVEGWGFFHKILIICIFKASTSCLRGCLTLGVAFIKRYFTSFRCETCSQEEAKYRCPRCMKYSCSLLCVKKHKLALSCNGVRDKTAFVSVNEFTDLNLLSVWGLEYIIHMFIKKLNKARKCDIDLRTLWLQIADFCVHDEPCLMCLIFIFGERVPDDKTLADILKPYIDPVESDPVVCQRLKIYTVSPQSDVQILMKIENRKQNSVRYYELDASRSLLDNLKGKVIIEYPTFFVVLKTLKNDMVILGQGKYLFPVLLYLDILVK
uniref:Box C/D snoRNA protein 1 n=1 Tax=Melopsittacus undulatus TaxID=13146 RepID=A0A8V5G3G8_MELUD